MPEGQINLEPFISYYYYINARPKVSSRRRKETKEFKRSQNHCLSSYVNDDARTFVYPESDVLYRKEKEARIRGERDEQDYYPLEIVRSNDLVRIITQMPVAGNKRNIKVKIYNDTLIEISVNDDDTLQKNKKYYRIIEIPKDADIETAKCTYRNGILEITFKQKKSKRKAKERGA
jgi:HSP20 family molecular chaperone IbpA